MLRQSPVDSPTAFLTDDSLPVHFGMVKKGKGGGTPSSASSSSKASGKKAAVPAPDDDLLIFTTDKKKKGGPASKNGAPPGTAASGPGATDAPLGPPKPTVKQLIGGQSWTGKLPVNLLSEHCQKMKWERPDYDTVSGLGPASCLSGAQRWMLTPTS